MQLSSSFISPAGMLQARVFRRAASRSRRVRFGVGLFPFLLLLGLRPALALDDIPPPFGFRWNDSAAKVEQVLTMAKAKIVSREQKDKREVWTVIDLVQPGLKRSPGSS